MDGRKRPDTWPTQYAEQLRTLLVAGGYSPTTVRNYELLLARFADWRPVARLDSAERTEARVRTILARRRARGDCPPSMAVAIGALITKLRELGAVAENEPSPVQRLVADYGDYLLGERRLAEPTVGTRCGAVAGFLTWRVAEVGGLDLPGLAAGDLHRYVVAEARRLSHGSVGNLLDTLRSFLRFGYATGLMPADLSAVFPPIATRPHPAVPRTVDPGLLWALLNSCDRDKPVGLRDFAILMLMGRLGLRGGEITAMRLDDIDWRAGDLLVRGKGGRNERMPLPADVGTALVDYLRLARPAGDCRAVFLKVLAPYGALGRFGVLTVPRVACRRAGVTEVGGHQLRRGAAVSLVESGGSWTELGQLLRHSRSQTSSRYAAISPHALDEVARPWPAVTR